MRLNSSTILAGLSIQAANGSTKAELKRTAQMALRHLGYWATLSLRRRYAPPIQGPLGPRSLR